MSDRLGIEGTPDLDLSHSCPPQHPKIGVKSVPIDFENVGKSDTMRLMLMAHPKKFELLAHRFVGTESTQLP